MSAKRKHQKRQITTPPKPELEITSSDLFEINETTAPDTSIPSLKNLMGAKTSSTTSTDEDDLELNAPLRLPSQESLTQFLVPSNLVYQLEEYRSDENRASSILFLFLGAALGVFINWITVEPISFSIASAIIFIAFLFVSIIFCIWVFNFKKRADRKIEEIRKSQRIPSPFELKQ